MNHFYDFYDGRIGWGSRNGSCSIFKCSLKLIGNACRHFGYQVYIRCMSNWQACSCYKITADLLPFLNIGDLNAVFHSCGSTPSWNDFLNNRVMWRASSSAAIDRISGLILSGSGALLEFNPESSFLTSSTPMSKCSRVVVYS